MLSIFTAERLLTKAKSAPVLIVSCYLLVSPPLHLSLVVADVISFLAFSQVGNPSELLVVVHELVFSTNAVHGIFDRRTTGSDASQHSISLKDVITIKSHVGSPFLCIICAKK